MLRWRLVGVLALSVVAWLLACAGGVAAQTPAAARLRVVHLSPDIPALDVMIDGQRVVAGLPFKSASPYAPLAAGSRNVRVTSAAQSGNTILSTEVPLQAGQNLTLVAVGRAAEISALPLLDENSPPPAGKAKVRFVHASPDAPPVDIAARGGPVLFPNVGFKSVAGYVAVDAGTYSLEVRPAGTTTVALTVPDVTLRPGQVVTFFGSGLLSTNTLGAVVVEYTGDVGAQAAAAAPRAGVGGLAAADTPTTPSLAVALLLTGVVLITGASLATRRWAARRSRS